MNYLQTEFNHILKEQVLPWGGGLVPVGREERRGKGIEG
jgi:hypothetical protein